MNWRSQTGLQFLSAFHEGVKFWLPRRKRGAAFHGSLKPRSNASFSEFIEDYYFRFWKNKKMKKTYFFFSHEQETNLNLQIQDPWLQTFWFWFWFNNTTTDLVSKFDLKLDMQLKINIFSLNNQKPSFYGMQVGVRCIIFTVIDEGSAPISTWHRKWFKRRGIRVNRGVHSDW